MILRRYFSLKMNIDPNFEFECPKWYDFTQEEDGGHEECLDDSWFEREHPLHEPKDKEQSLKELRPLIELNEKQTDNQTTKTGEKNKYKNPKKSLGVNRSVRLMRGEQGPIGRRKLPETTGLKRGNSSEGIKNEQRSGGRDLKPSQEDFGDNRNFTPPWGLNSPGIKPETSEDGNISPKTALLCSPLRGPVLSPPINSPKNTLLAKAVNKATRMNQKSKRRILPSIPCSNQTTAHLPLRGTLQSESQTPPSSEESKTRKEQNKNPMNDTTSDKQFLNPIRHNTDSSNIMTREQKDQDMNGISDGNARNESPVSVEDLLKLHNQKVLASKSNYDSNGRKIQRRSVTAVCSEGVNSKTFVNNNIDQKNSEEGSKEEEISVGTTTVNNLGIINEEINSMKKEGSKSVENNESQVKTTEALLKLHNQRIMASRCKYDSNGRRIRTATPSFCAAPTKSDVAEKTSVARSKGRRSVPTTTTTAVGKKRPNTTNCETKAKTKQKQQRRSCVVASKTQETLYATENTKQEEIENEQRKTTSKCSSSNLKRNAVTQDAKGGQNNKRRSCVAAPVSSQSSCTNKGTSLAAQNRQKRRSCVAAPQTPKRLGSDSVDQELKDLIQRHNQRLAKKK